VVNLAFPHPILLFCHCALFSGVSRMDLIGVGVRLIAFSKRSCLRLASWSIPSGIHVHA
jgi:hypothetical protein